MSSEQILSALRKLEDNLSEKFESRFAAFELQINGRFDAFEVRLSRVEAECQMLTVGLRRVEEGLSAVEGRLSAVEGRLVDVEKRLTGVEDRLAAVERRLAALEGRVGIDDVERERL